MVRQTCCRRGFPANPIRHVNNTGTLFPQVAFCARIVGQFMHYLPVDRIITLFITLVAYIFNPVFAVSFMAHEYDSDAKAEWKQTKKVLLGMFALAVVFTLSIFGIGNFIVFAILMVFCTTMSSNTGSSRFRKNSGQNDGWLRKPMRWVLHGYQPVWLLGGMIVLFFITINLTIVKPKVLFFQTVIPTVLWYM